MTAWLLSLAVFSGLSLNLVLHVGVGAREIALDEGKPATGRGSAGDALAFFLRLCVFFLLVSLLWLAFSLARSLLPLGFLEYVFVFPAGFVAASGWNRLAGSFEPSFPALSEGCRLESWGGALSGAALFVTLALAGSLAEAAALSLGFAFGALLARAIVEEIKRRAATEAVHPRLRGAPLALVAMGLLSLVFSSVAAMFFEVLGRG